MDRPWADNRKVLEGILWVLRSESANLMLEHPELAERERRFLYKTIKSGARLGLAANFRRLWLRQDRLTVVGHDFPHLADALISRRCLPNHFDNDVVKRHFAG
jgi:hypothetical protein